MATINQARFKISGTPSVDPVTGDREYSAVLSETLTCTLEANPSLALSATFEIFDANDPESPFASKDAPLRTWNENGLPAITVGQVPLGINDDVTIDMPAAVRPPLPNIHSYVIRCTVSTPGDGSPESQVQVFERQVLIFGVNTDPVLRKTVPGETTQARVRAWSDSFNDLIDAMDNLNRASTLSGFIQGLHYANNGGTPLTIVDIDPGSAASEDGTFLIESSGTLVVDIAATGINGRDTGAVTNAWWALWLIADSSGVEPVAGLLSLSFTEGGLVFPAGYDVARRVGAIRTIAALTIRPFGQPKAEGRQRWTYWKDNLVIQTNGTATTYTNTASSAAARVAPSAVRQQIGQLTSKLGGASVLAASNVIPDGWNEAAGNNAWHVAVGFTNAGDITSNGVIVMPVGPARLVRYLVEPAGDAEVTITVQGWEDSL